MRRDGIERYKDGLVFVALIIVLGAIPLVFTSNYHLSVMIFIGLHTMLAVGLCLLMGYTGQVSLGHAAFYGIGAYISGILTTKGKIDPWLAMLLAAAFTAIVAYVIGYPMFRLRGHNLAMGTLGFGIIVYIVFVEMGSLTGGPSGLTGIPYLSLFGFTFDKDIEFYYLTWALALAFLVLSLNIVNSRVGRALRAIHGSEIAAETLGINASKYKVQILVVGATYASIAGSVYAHYLTVLNPSPFGLKFSIEILVMVVIGGLASVWGSIFGAAATTLLSEVLRGYVPELLKGASGRGASGEYEIVVFGLILMAVMIFLPEGLAPGFLRLVKRWRRMTIPKVSSAQIGDSAVGEIAKAADDGRLAIKDK